MTRALAIGASLLAAIVAAASGCSDGNASSGPDPGAAPAAVTTSTESAPATTTTAEPPPPESQVPRAEAFAACAGAGDFWPTMTLALQGTSVWVACKEESRLVRLKAGDGSQIGEVELDWEPIAVVAGLGSVWALDSEATLYRIDPSSGNIQRRIELNAGAPYNLWIGAGSVWSVDDEAGQVLRVDPKRNRVTARIKVGNGPADMIFRGSTAWVVNHRTATLVRLDTKTKRTKKLGKLRPSEAPERMAWLAGSLWITGRGTDLLQVDPATGRALKVVDIGAGGIDIVAAGGALWVPSRNAQVDPTGLPTMEWLKRATPTGRAKTKVRATGPVDVHGLVASTKFVWFADNTAGLVYRVPIH